MKEKFIRFFKDEEGIETVEYALIAALIAIAIIIGATFLGDTVNNVYSTVGSVVSSNS
jgi:pilus assembly protein Flp/PilA